jgi:serine/threonine protein phosphatase PrpC
MSLGSEGKSVENQKSRAAVTRQDPAISHAREAERKRQRQALELQRERILSERTASPHRRTALTNALADVEEKLAELGWTIHM